MKLEISGDALQKFEYAGKHINSWIRSAVGDKAHAFVPFAKASFDVYFDSITGETRRDIVTWFSKRASGSEGSTWYVRPVYHGGGSPNASVYNYLYKWIPGAARYSGTDRDFMGRAFDMWKGGANLEAYIAQVVGDRFNGLS